MDSNPACGLSYPPGPTDFYLYKSESDTSAGAQCGWQGGAPWRLHSWRSPRPDALAALRAGVPWGSGRYPFPADAPIEGAYTGCSMTDCDTDRHVIAVDQVCGAATPPCTGTLTSQESVAPLLTTTPLPPSLHPPPPNAVFLHSVRGMAVLRTAEPKR